MEGGLGIGGLHAALAALFLHFVRAGTFLAVMPLFGRQRDTLMLRIVLAVALGTVFWWVGDRAVPVEGGGLVVLLVMAVREALIGLALGFGVYLLLTVVVAAGEILSHEMGFAMSRTMDPDSGADTTVVSQLLQVFAFLLVLQLDLHHDALRILSGTYSALPVGRPFDFAPIAAGLGELTGDALELAVHYALPVLGVMVLVTAVLVMLARAVPHINLLEFSFGLRILIALLAAIWFLVDGLPFLDEAFRFLLEGTAAVFGVA